MPLWLLKFIPFKTFLGPLFKALVPYWKPILAAIVFAIYSFTLNSCAVDRTNAKWEVKEAARIEQELKAKNKALSEAAELKRQQDSAAAAREEQLRKDKEAAEKRASDARAEAAEQRRLNNETTNKFKALQAASGSGPVTLDPDGVRDSLRESQDAVRSRRRP